MYCTTLFQHTAEVSTLHGYLLTDPLDFSNDNEHMFYIRAGRVDVNRAQLLLREYVRHHGAWDGCVTYSCHLYCGLITFETVKDSWVNLDSLGRSLGGSIHDILSIHITRPRLPLPSDAARREAWIRFGSFRRSTWNNTGPKP